MSSQTRGRGRLDALLWAMFAQCAVITAMLAPAQILVLGVLRPLGLAPAIDGSYATFHTALSNPLVRIYLGVVAALCFYVFAHRVRYMLHDLGLHVPKYALAAVMYGLALVATAYSAYVLITV